MTLQPGTPIGKYLVRRKLAEGGMAELYLCTIRGPEGFEKEVVIKRIRSFLASDPSFVQMFIAEARLASRLNHPNVVQIFDFEKHEDTYYIAMEYVRGRSLWEVQQRSRELMLPLPHTLVAQLGAEVARGLHYAHALRERGQPLGLVHRDVTPHNVLLSFDGAVKLTDFGIAKAGSKVTAPGTLKGKFAYMAPEQARGEEVDARTDVFALGVVLWELLTGGRLFEDESDLAVLRAVQHRVIAAPARINPEVPPELDAVVMKALEREPSRRFQAAQEMEHRLARHLLATAQGPEDTDLGAYLRQLVGAESTSLPAVGGGTGTGDSPPTTENIRRGADFTPLAPDEDPNASTLVLNRHPELSGPREEPKDEPVPLAPARYRPLKLAVWAGMLALAGALFWAWGRPAEAPAPPTATVEAASPPPVEQPPPKPTVPEPSGAPAVHPEPAEVGRELLEDPGREGEGLLTLNIQPYAKVEVDGRHLGELEGVRRITLPAGKHRVRFRHPKRSDEVELAVQAGQETYHLFLAH